MKRYWILLLAGFWIICLAGCSEDNPVAPNPPDQKLTCAGCHTNEANLKALALEVPEGNGDAGEG
jgi:hypothetical protein